MPNYAMRRDRPRQKGSGSAKKWYKRMLHRFERRQAKLQLRYFLTWEIL